MTKRYLLSLLCLVLSVTVTATYANVYEQSGHNCSQVIINVDNLFAAFNVTADAYVDSRFANNNYGGDTLIRVESDAATNKRGLLRFDLGTLPTNIEVVDANLSLYYYGFAYGNDPVGRTYDCYRLTETDWIEGTQSGKKERGACSWDFRQYLPSNGLAWTTTGGTYTTVNGSSSVIPPSFGWMSWNVTDLVQYVADQPAQVANLLVKDASEDSTTSYAAIFYSRESSYPSQIPILEVRYRTTS